MERIHSTANESLAEVKVWADESDRLHSQSISQQLPQPFMLVLTQVTPAEGATAKPTPAWLLEDLWPVNGVLKVSSFTKREPLSVKPALQSLIKPLSIRAVCRASVNQNRRILHLLVDRLQRVILLDKAPSTVKAYFMAASKHWHRWSTVVKLPTIPAKALHVAQFLLHLAQQNFLIRNCHTISRRTTVDERESRCRQPDEPPHGQTAMPIPASSPQGLQVLTWRNIAVRGNGED